MFMNCLIVAAVLVLSANCADYNWGKVEATVETYRMSGAFAGGVLRVSNSTHTIYNLPFGQLSHNELPYSSAAITNETIFDMASVTKVTATLSCIMRLYDLGLVDI